MVYGPGTGRTAEYERVVYGTARQPQFHQRVVRVNEEPFQLNTTEYNCDRCDVSITPGEAAVAWTVWRADRSEPAPWEHEYLL